MLAVLLAACSLLRSFSKDPLLSSSKCAAEEKQKDCRSRSQKLRSAASLCTESSWLSCQVHVRPSPSSSLPALCSLLQNGAHRPVSLLLLRLSLFWRRLWCTVCLSSLLGPTKRHDVLWRSSQCPMTLGRLECEPTKTLASKLMESTGHQKGRPQFF